MEILKNPLRGLGLPPQSGLATGATCTDPTLVESLLSHCPAAGETPLHHPEQLAVSLDIADLYIKDERARMGLGSFKALGAAFAIAKHAHQQNGDAVFDADVAKSALSGQTFVTASAGNHGLSVAAGARMFGADAVIYLAETVPAGFADRLRQKGAQVVVQGTNYEASMAAAAQAATKNGWILLSDSTWAGYSLGGDVMEGYLAMAAEITNALPAPGPSHVFLQAGVGGLAAAMTAYLRKTWGQELKICVVEPDAAPALMASIKAEAPVHAPGPSSIMGRLDCKEPSHLALQTLAREADTFMTLSDKYVSAEIAQLEPLGLETSASGGAGFAGLVAARSANELGLSQNSRVLVILSEGPADD